MTRTDVYASLGAMIELLAAAPYHRRHPLRHYLRDGAALVSSGHGGQRVLRCESRLEMRPKALGGLRPALEQSGRLARLGQRRRTASDPPGDRIVPAVVVVGRVGLEGGAQPGHVRDEIGLASSQ